MTEILIAIFFLVLSVIYTEDAFSLAFGSIMAPKAGFMPRIAGGIAILLALVLIISALFRKGCKEAGNVKADSKGRKLIFLIIGILVYLILLRFLGYMAATFISLFYLLKVTETAGWVYPCFFSAGIAGSFYFLFSKLLGTNLP
ncbi:Tripartite tricarboxylate transporter TctB family protein [Sporomusa ovata DSM 2662]|uniref:DUF1468 domain-containing protein n=1 Tax=Sporomusa ovata TaxID=2378 RepID=A0A0U1KTQ8_9FIRM|nr:tripartite tricarboxylate transporter TctB family protein [Sporomusa ovata]EQB26717.1 tripartite tricarboxylate transporter TctB family [Sporomusa ovata DSM 2662]CQR70811.1 hypothetical protein SpAn4DRAFT_1789 [Sporomusa ovata]